MKLARTEYNVPHNSSLSAVFKDRCCWPTYELLDLSITAFISSVARHNICRLLSFNIHFTLLNFNTDKQCSWAYQLAIIYKLHVQLFCIAFSYLLFVGWWVALAAVAHRLRDSQSSDDIITHLYQSLEILNISRRSFRLWYNEVWL